MRTKNNAKELVKAVIARWQATHHIELCEFANMRAERRNRKVMASHVIARRASVAQPDAAIY